MRLALGRSTVDYITARAKAAETHAAFLDQMMRGSATGVSRQLFDVTELCLEPALGLERGLATPYAPCTPEWGRRVRAVVMRRGWWPGPRCPMSGLSVEAKVSDPFRRRIVFCPEEQCPAVADVHRFLAPVRTPR